MATESSDRLELQIRGMCCAEEVRLLKSQLVPLVKDEQRLGFDLINTKLTVDLTHLDASTTDVLAAVERTGMHAEIWRDNSQQSTDEGFWTRNQRLILTAVSGIFALLGLTSQLWLLGWESGDEAMPVLSVVLYGVGILAGVWLVLPKAWRSARSRHPDMNLLMTIAVVGAVLIGEWFEAATVAFLFSVSLLLESWSVGRARQAIASLMDLSPTTARVRTASGEIQQMAPADVSVGTMFVVRPGERIPLDGRVVSGSSDVDQATITGESARVDKAIGNEVFAGTINGDGLLEVESSKPAEETTLARIIQLVGEARSRRAAFETWVEQFAAVYTPLVMLAAALVLFVPPLLLGADWSEWIYRSLVLLVIACPCALVISTPVSVVAALASAARNGVLIKGGVFMELPAWLQAIAMDKTGTLTQGQPRVVDIAAMNGYSEAELLTLAGALESHSNHPLARAILAEANRRSLSLPHVDDFQTTPGKGATGWVDGQQYWLGSPRYLQQRGQSTAEIQRTLESRRQAGWTAVVVGNDELVFGFILLADVIRDEAKASLAELHQLGIQHLVMLTGDDEDTANLIAEQAGIDEIHAGLLPEEKVRVVESLVAKYHQVAMVGDGVNDSPALARASMGIAMGAAGSDAAIETADVALMADDLAKLPWLIRHSRRTLRIIRQNIVFALGIKVLFVALTFVGYASLWAAIAADMGASLLVIFNGLRLLRFRYN